MSKREYMGDTSRKFHRNSLSSSELTTIPGVGTSIAKDLQQLGILSVSDLRGQDPEALFQRSNQLVGSVQDRCLLYVFRCAVYFAEGGRDTQKLKWWNWKDSLNGRNA